MPEAETVDLTPWLKNDPFTIAADVIYRVVFDPIVSLLDEASALSTARWCRKILAEMK